MLKNPVLKTALVLSAFIGIGCMGLLRCTRDNPIDPKSNDFIPGTAPDAGFVADTVSCLATDSVQIAVFYSDTQAYGGKTPMVIRLYFNWTGDSSIAAMTDSVTVSGAGPITIRRAFPTARNVVASVRARDNDNKLGPAGRVRLIVTVGVLPEVRFLRDTVTGFIWDSIPVSVAFSDTQAYGGKTPAIQMLYFNWYGNSANLNDSVSAAALADSTTVYKIFWLILPNNRAYVRARDNDGQLSPLDSMWIIVDQGRPKIDSSSASADTIALGDSVTITASASDTNGTINAFVWTVAGKDTTTAAGVLKVLFGAEGTQAVVVRARDNDLVLSRPDTVRIRVIDRAGPEIQYLTYHNGDSVIQLSPTITMTAQTRDPSGILFMYINGALAAKSVDTAWPGWQLWQQNVTLTEGRNTITVQSWDKSTGSNTTRDSIAVYYKKPDNTPPAIVFSTPQPGDTVRDTLYPSPVTVIVSVSDPSGVAWVRCNGNPMSNPSGNSYQTDVMLNEGSDSLIITAADTKGNNAADTLFIAYVVVRDNTPPTLRIVTPQPNQKILADSVMVIALASDTLGPAKSGIDSVTINGLRAIDTVFGTMVHYMLKVPLVHGYDTIRVSAVDSSGNRTNDQVIVLRNVPPHFVPDISVKDTSFVVNTASIIPVCASDTESDTLTFAFITLPAKDPAATITKSGACANIAYTATSAGLDTFRIRVTDSLGASDTLKIGVTVTPASGTRPYFTNSTLPDTAFLDSLYTVQLTAVDPQSLTLTYSLLPPTPSGVSITSDSGLVTWTPAALGKDTIVAMAANSIPASDTLTWIVTVVLRNMPPVLQNPGDKIVDEGKLLQFTLAATDTNNDSLFYSFGSTYPAGAVLDSASGVFSWTPGYRDAGDHTVIFRVTEKNRTPALSDQKTITISVNNVNNPPVLVDPGNKTINELELLMFNLQATDINGDSITYSISGKPDGMLLYGTNIVWRPKADQAGVYPITFIATDNGNPSMADSVTDTFTVVDTTVPVFTPHALEDTVLVGFPYITTISAADGDNDTLTYTKLSGPDSLFVGAKNGGVLWVPKTAGFNERATVSVTARDSAGNLDTLTWTILVLRWPRIYISPATNATNDTGFSVVETREGGYAVCGTIADNAGTYSLGFFVRTDTSGNPIIPTKTYPGNEGQLSLFSMQQMQPPDNGFIMCGTDSSATARQTKLVLIRTDPAGQPLVSWPKTYSDMNGVYPSAKGVSVCQTSDNGFIACGAALRSIPILSPNDAYVIKTTPDGTPEWDRVYTNGPRSSVAYSIQETPWDNGYILCGQIREVGPSGIDAYLVKADKFGDTVWWRSYNLGGDERATSVLALGGAVSMPEYLIGGYSSSNSGGGTKGIVMKVNQFGDTAGGGWVRQLPPTSAVISIRPTMDGDFIACGTGVGGGTSTSADALLCRFTGSGTLDRPTFHGAGFNDGGFSAVPTIDGGFILTGFATILGGLPTDIYLVKTDKMGTLEKTFGPYH